jgi:phospholipid/cholesterol/gamma-HCH transport system substrate-binding protein
VQAVSGNARQASADLGALRADVDASLRKVDRLLSEVNRKWPFATSAKDAEIKLP